MCSQLSRNGIKRRAGLTDSPAYHLQGCFREMGRLVKIAGLTTGLGRYKTSDGPNRLTALSSEVFFRQKTFYTKQSIEDLLNRSQVHRLAKICSFFCGVYLNHFPVTGGEDSPATPSPCGDVVAKPLMSTVSLAGSKFRPTYFAGVQKATSVTQRVNR